MLIIIYLFILVAPMIWIPNQLIGAAIGNPDVTLECIIDHVHAHFLNNFGEDIVLLG